MLCIDGQFINPTMDSTGIWVNSEGLQFGFGVFETLRVVQQTPEHLLAHLNRLTVSANILGIHIPEILTKPEAFLSCLLPGLLQCEQALATLKIGLVKDGSSSHWWVQLKPFPYKKTQVENGIKATFSHVRRNSSSLFTFHKTMNYAENWFERQKAVENGYQEVLFLNENEQIAEGAATNLFFVKNGKWHTPSVDCGLLNGIMRQHVMDAVTCRFGSVVEGRFDRCFLEDADQVFLTNSLMGIMPVIRIDQSVYPLPDQAMTRFLQAIDEKRLMFE